MEIRTIVSDFTEHVKELSKANNEPNWLLSLRMESLINIEHAPLHDTKYTRLSKIFPKWLQATHMSLGKEARVIGFERKINESLKDVDHDKEVVVITLNGEVKELSCSLEELDNMGVRIANLFTEAVRCCDDFEILFKERRLRSDEDKFIALNMALSDKGLFLNVTPNTEVEKTIRIINFISTGEKVNFIHNLYNIGNGSKVNIVEETYSLDDKFNMNMVMTELILGENSYTNYFELYKPNDETDSITYKRFTLNRNSKVDIAVAWMGGKKVLSNLKSDLIGEGAEVNQVEVLFGSNKENFELFSTLDHIVGNTNGYIVHRGVLKDQSKQIYHGLIRIRNGAQGSDALLQSHSILLDRQAAAFDVPGLEISANDVKATHSASVAPIDEDQVYYLRSRGIEDFEARKLIVFGFLEPAVERIKNESVKNTIKEIIEKKWFE